MLRTMLLAGAAAALAFHPVVAASRSALSLHTEAAGPVAPADLAALVADYTIPYQSFTLANGLRVIVMTDRSAPLVYTSIMYDVGSADEPEGRSGFAHLFEHLMFNGSENVPGDYFAPLRNAGVVGINGTTSYDYTKYHETVPTGSLDRVLFMEGDRMGHLLGALTQATLDEQRGVVQNEKREKDNLPGSIGEYMLRAALYPKGHPYGHAPVGSMKDLNAASIEDVRRWFRDHYGPNNATMILAGDIDLATAKAKVDRYFGDIPRGRDAPPPTATPPVLAAAIDRTLTAPVTETTILRVWPGPGIGSADGAALSAAAELMTGIDGAPLEEALVERDKLFSWIVARNDQTRGGAEFSIRGGVREGVDPQVAGRALDTLIAEFLRRPPAADALRRYKSAFIIPTIRINEGMEARADLLLRAAVFRGSAGAYKQELEQALNLTPGDVAAAARKWLTRPGYRMVMTPGPRMTPPGDEIAGAGSAATAAAAAAVPPVGRQAEPRSGARGALPAIGEPGKLHFPDIQHAVLKNGIPVVYVPSQSLPFTQLILAFPAGRVDAAVDKPEAFDWMFSLLNQGAAGHDRHWFDQQRELTGVDVGGGADDDGVHSALFAGGPTASFGRVLDTAMMMLTQPDFPVDRIEDRRQQNLAALAAVPTSAQMLANTALARALAPGSSAARLAAIPTPERIKSITRADLQAAFQRWVRPQGARIFVVSNAPLSTLLPQMNATLGRWTGADAPAGKPVPRVLPTASASPHIVLIDMPEAVQASVTGGQLLSIPYGDETLMARVANTPLAGEFLSRINMNLREDKHWSYGAVGAFENDPLISSYAVETEIQPDKVGAGIAEIRRDVQEILSTRPITQPEFAAAVENRLRKRVGMYRTSSEMLLGAKLLSDKGWPDDFHTRYDERLKALTLAGANAELRKLLDPAKWVWVVTGNAKVIRPQLDMLGLPVEVVTPAQVVAGT
ncbi:M16 family metallopeptidase [Sphingomonas sp. CLY1604]|uniref:M16 family metallopeptidase n=1 Tax=Sphingomonas sp. CLY1604 TaxID=3457786 RepID=UPI003FD808A0